MGLKGLTRIASIMVIFFFLPSIAIKIWEYVIYAPWPAKSWLVYLALGIILIYLARKRWRKRLLLQQDKGDDSSLMYIAKERLVKGEISITEFQEIKQELTGRAHPNSSRNHKLKDTATERLSAGDAVASPKLEEQEV